MALRMTRSPGVARTSANKTAKATFARTLPIKAISRIVEHAPKTSRCETVRRAGSFARKPQAAREVSIEERKARGSWRHSGVSGGGGEHDVHHTHSPLHKSGH